MLKIGVYSDKFDSVRDFYRGLGVLSRLRKCRVTKLSLESLLIFEHYDIIFLSSPIHSTNLNVIQYAKDQKIKIWVDFDDYIPDVQSDNAAYDFGIQPGNIANMFACIREADLVTVTTEFLKGKLSNKNIHVIPNAFNDYCFKLEYKPGKAETVAWRGAIDGHGRDLVSQVEDLMKLDKLFDDNGWTFSFLGRNPWYVTDYLKNWTRTPELPFFQFMASFKHLNPAVFMYPLVDCDFNRSKSQLAWLDATYSGAACLVPDFEVYENMPVLTYKDDFYEMAEQLIGDFSLRLRLYQDSIRAINERFLLSRVNEQRFKLAHSIL